VSPTQLRRARARAASPELPEASRAVPASEARRQLRRRDRRPLVGREGRVDQAFTRLIEGGSVAVVGRRGSGRTRVLAELQRLYPGPSLWLEPDPATAGLPLEVLRRALPELGDLADRPLGEARAAVAARLRELAGGQQLLVVVDDAHFLDPTTAAGLREVVEQLSWCAVLCSVPTDTPITDAGRASWDHPHVERLELAPLSAVEVEQLAAVELGGRLDLGLVAELRTRAGGSPVAVVELLRGALETGALTFDGEVWCSSMPLPVHRVAAWLVPRLEALDGPVREAAELVAVAGPLPEGTVAVLTAADAVQGLVAAGFAHWRWGAGRRRHLTGTDALEGEAIASTLGGRRRVALLHRVLAAADRAGGEQLDPARVARWRLELGDGQDPALFDRAARAAYGAGAYALAAQLGRAAMAQGGGSRSAMAAGAAVVELGELEEGERLLAAAAAGATDAGERAWSTIALAHAWWARGGRWTEADGLLDQLRQGLGDPALRVDVEAYRTLVAAVAGRYDEALEGLRRGAGPATPRAVEGSRAALLLGAAAALLEEDRPAADACRTARALGATVDVEVAPALPLGGALLRAAELTATADPDHGVAAARAELERALTVGADDEPAWWSLVAGRHALRAGRVTVAEAHLGDAVRGFERVDSLRLRPAALVQLARARAWGGANAAARAALEQLPAGERGSRPRLAAWAELAEAEILADEDPLAAAAAAADLATRQADGGSVAVVVAAGELVLVVGTSQGGAGPCRTVAATLRRLSAQQPTVAVTTLADAADALAVGDGAELATAARQLAGGGRRLVAAALAHQAATALTTCEGGPTEVVAALARGLRTACAGATIPGRGPSAPVVLSPRVRLAARAAATGVASADLAAQLGVSVRTVESHLGRAYRALGVRGRGELARCYPLGLAPLSDA
jgi:DNA-binding NarL/FixJ family response regulator